MNSESPLVSIGMPVYNAENFLAEALDSLISQSYSNFEILISDNCSSDRTQEISEDYVSRDSRIRYIKQPKNWGAAFNYNYVVHNTTGKYFKWAAHDDICGPDFLQICVTQLEIDPTISLAATKTTIIDKDGREVKQLKEEISITSFSCSGRLREYLSGHYLDREANQVFGVYRRDFLEKTALIASYPSSDLTLLGQIAMLGNINLCESPIFYRRDHDNTSLRAAKSKKDIAHWFETSRSNKREPLPYLSRLLGFVTFATGRPIPLREKFVCLSIILKWGWRHRYAFKDEARDYFGV